MRRRFFTVTSLLSLLLCVATVVMWVRSYIVSDVVRHFRFHEQNQWTYERDTTLVSGCGGIGVSSAVIRGDHAIRASFAEYFRERNRPVPDSMPHHSRSYPQYPNFSYGHERSKWGFKWERITGATGSDGTPLLQGFQFVIPIWVLVLLLSPLSVAGVWRWLRPVRGIDKGHCPSCRYNLTGNTSGVCPECGTSINSAKS